MAAPKTMEDWKRAPVGAFGGQPALIQDASGRWLEVAPGTASNGAVYGTAGCKAALGTAVAGGTKWKRVKVVIREKTAAEKAADAAGLLIRALGLAAVVCLAAKLFMLD